MIITDNPNVATFSALFASASEASEVSEALEASEAADVDWCVEVGVPRGLTRQKKLSRSLGNFQATFRDLPPLLGAWERQKWILHGK